MPFKFFAVPARDDGTAAEELNSFLQSHRILAVDRRWVDQGVDSFWAICVDYRFIVPFCSPANRTISDNDSIVLWNAEPIFF